MSGTHHRGVDALHVSTGSLVEHLAPQVKLVCLLAFVVAVAATPQTALWAFGAFAFLVAIAGHAARLPWRVATRRLTIEVPFLLFAFALPLIGTGPRVTVVGLSLSEAGSWAAWSILAKATLCTSACIVLTWSTPVADILRAFDTLRVPRVLVAIIGFMVRYLDVIALELRRMQIARVSRGDDPRWIWQGRAIASTAGTLFVRSFERGERVQQAMLARGFDGRFPRTTGTSPSASWWPALVLPAVALVTAGAALASGA